MRVPVGMKSIAIGSAVKVEPSNGGAEMPKQPVLNRPLYTDKDKKLVLEEGDPKSRFVIGGEGSPVLDEDIEKYGLNESHFLVEQKKDAPLSENESAQDMSWTADEGLKVTDIARNLNDDKEESDTVDLESMTKAELVEYAESAGVEVKASWTKPQIIEALQAE